jgi:SAM-dependent methyltransferase
MFIQKIIGGIERAIEKLFPEENISSSKNKWNKLAKKNPKFYIVSRVGEQINEEQFNKIGRENYHDFVLSDDLLKKRLINFKDKIALDIGCGIGRLTELFAADFKEVYGTDISEEMIKQGKERLYNFKNVHLYATDGLNYPFEDNFFDLIFSFVVFHHMPNKEVIERNFKEVYRTLKNNVVAKIQIRGGRQPYRWQWYHGKAFNKEEALQMLQKIGFRILKIEGENSKFFWLWLAK